MESSASWAYEDWLVSSPDDRDALEFSPETAGTEAAKAFVAETDLSEQTLFVRQYRVSDCISVTLDQIKWNEIRGDFEVRLDYSDSLKNENCEDATAHETEVQKDIEAIIARIPLEEVRSISVMA